MSTPADILIIDDDRDLVNSIDIILQTKNYQVRSAFNGKEGYDKIKKRIPDLILLDVMMATDTEGFDLAYKLREDPKYANIPIIMITSFTQKMAEEGPDRFQHILGEAWPVSFFLEKPIDPEVLLATVEKVLSETSAEA
jgi:two-component system phosphate regulon response regulator PhoB/two-component system alkaline phosphatase synthesis response regulator PhoP/two-component system response regulator VicR